MQSRVKQTVSYTWTIKDFAKQSSWIQSPNFSSSPNEKGKTFGFDLYSQMEPANDHVFIKFWHDYDPYVKSYFKYRVSILGKSIEAVYSREYLWRYDGMCCYNMVNFIFKSNISEFLVNGHLTLFLEVDILDGPNYYDNKKVLPKADDNLSVDYQSLLESGDFSDVICVVRGKEFKAHKAILAARSSVFKAMFSVDLEEKKKNRVEIRDVEPDVFGHLLRYIYSGKICEDLARFGLDLFVAADKYHLDHLKAICEQSLGSSLAIESVCNVLLIADMHNADNLKANCIEFIAKNSVQVLTTDGWKMVKSKLNLVLAILENMSAQNQSFKF